MRGWDDSLVCEDICEDRIGVWVRVKNKFKVQLRVRFPVRVKISSTGEHLIGFGYGLRIGFGLYLG